MESKIYGLGKENAKKKQKNLTQMYVINLKNNLEFSIYTHKFKWLLGTEINAGFKVQI